MAWNLRLGRPRHLEKNGIMFLEDQFWGQSQIDVLEFSELHKAYLGIAGSTYDAVLSSTERSTVDRTDAMGRTTLSWASQRGDGATVAQLLTCGADPNVRDKEGKTPLHWSTYAASSACMQHLLAAKADLEAKDFEGDTVLAYSVFADLETTRLLLLSGAQLECKNNNGWRPLHYAAAFGNVEHVIFLLETRADINATTSHGNTALDLAIQHNSHASLRILLKVFDSHAQVSDHYSQTTLPTAALLANKETLDIMNATGITNVDLQTRGWKNYTALEMAKWRKNHHEDWMFLPRDDEPIAWFESFQTLVDGIETRQKARLKSLETESGDATVSVALEKGIVRQAEDLELWHDAPEVPISASD